MPAQPPLTWISHSRQPLPSTALAWAQDTDAPGLLAAGGELTNERLREAYSMGVFPWYSQGQPVLWWSTDPRMVLQVADFKLSRSLRKTITRFAREPRCEIRVDSSFDDVIEHCAGARRRGQSGTWIVPEMVAAYKRWHREEHAVHSVETWIDGELAGGLYGVSLGHMFFGESMFSLRSDASKIALAALICFCREHSVPLVDCQQETSHLASLGALPIPRGEFEAHLARTVPAPGITDWRFEGDLWAHLLER